jgi:hypothetical protein
METIEIEVHPNSKLSKNSLHRVRTEGQSREVDKITRDERADGMMLGIEAMQIHGNWPSNPKVEIEVTQHYSNVSFDPDGLACVVAPYIDGAVDAGVMKDDGPKVVMAYGLRFQKVKTKAENKTVIKIMAVSE